MWPGTIQKLPIDNCHDALILERERNIMLAAAQTITDDGLSIQIGHTRLVVLRSRHQPKRAFHCIRCAEERGIKKSRHFLRIRRDRQLNIEWQFWECWACGHRIAL